MAAVSSEEKGDEAPRKEYGTPPDTEEKQFLGGNEASTHDIAVVKDGMKLHPQPTADPLDPLNWSSAKKHTILAIVMYL